MNMRQMAVTAALMALVVFALSACQLAPKTPRQALAASYVAVESIAESVEIARLDGVLTDDQAQEAKTQLLQALKYLDMAAGQIDIGQPGTDPLRRAQAILTTLHAILLEVSHEQPR